MCQDKITAKVACVECDVVSEWLSLCRNFNHYSIKFDRATGKSRLMVIAFGSAFTHFSPATLAQVEGIIPYPLIRTSQKSQFRQLIIGIFRTIIILYLPMKFDQCLFIHLSLIPVCTQQGYQPEGRRCDYLYNSKCFAEELRQ